MEHILHHTVFGFCWWDIPAALILVGIAVLLFMRHRNLKKRERELEDELSEIYADNSMETQ